MRTPPACARRTCRHLEAVHRHHRKGTDCGLRDCGCTRYQRHHTPALTRTAWLERRNACLFCGRRGVVNMTAGGRLHCYRDGCMRLASGP